jgi:hypothetical protein
VSASIYYRAHVNGPIKTLVVTKLRGGPHGPKAIRVSERCLATEYREIVPKTWLHASPELAVRAYRETLLSNRRSLMEQINRLDEDLLDVVGDVHPPIVNPDGSKAS